MIKKILAFITIFGFLSLSLSSIASKSNTSKNLQFLEDDNKLCCEACTEPKEKYYSIDPRFNLCGESCMRPMWFWLYKIFEPTLHKAETNTPCSDRDYTIYRSTPTHGIWPITMTLDLYKPTNSKKTEN